MKAFYVAIAIILFAVPARAGTTTIDFKDDIGILNNIAGPGMLTSEGGRAHFTGGNVSLVSDGGQSVTATGTVVASMALQPSVDTVSSNIGLVMFDTRDPMDMLHVFCSTESGLIHILTTSRHLEPGIVYTGVSFPNPTSPDSEMTLQYDCNTGTATLTIAGVAQAMHFPNALVGATSVHVGVSSTGVLNPGSGELGAGGFTRFTASGNGIPDYPPSDLDDDGVPDATDAFPKNPMGTVDVDDDGIGDEWEMHWFDNLTTADDASNYDADHVTDKQEFDLWYFHSDPTDGITQLPVDSEVLVFAFIMIVLAYRRTRARTESL
jgi:hypothetical protein